MTQRYPRLFIAGVVLLTLLLGSIGQTVAQRSSQGKGKHGAKQRNMRLLGHDDLQARSAYQPIIHKQGDREIAYVGHHEGEALNPLTGVVEQNGTSIVDVTNPRNPRYLFHLPGDAGGADGASGAQMVRACDGSDLPNGDAGKTYLLRTAGDLAHQVWDVTDPSSPTLVSTPVTDLNGTHKTWWECDTGIAYLVSGASGWRTERMTQVFDLSDPASPVHIRDFGLVGQEPGSAGPVPQELHGCISVVERNRVYCGHGTSSSGIFVVLDREKLLTGDPEPTPDNLNFPGVSRLDTPSFMGAHTTFPVLDVTVTEFAPEIARGSEPRADGTRDFIVLVNEANTDECMDPRQMVFLMDITEETKPWPVANFNVPEAKGDFCDRGGRFGAHASNESFTEVFYKKIMFVSWFNAGVRAIDIREPFKPREVAFFIPAITKSTDERCVTVDGEERCKVAIQTNNVEVDDRGLVYLADRANTGLHIVELTGRARRIADLP
jgi:hypothetical protein